MSFFLFFGIILVDQIVKLIVRLNMMPGESIPLVPQVFHFTYVLNPGAAFGILENQRMFFIVAGIVILLAVLLLYPRLRRQNPWLRYGCIALLGGAVGNLIDRIYNGLVVDFLDFRIWPVFNVADIAIVGGVGCMLYAILFKEK
ncbi:MAG: signal peptidase II [Selenomonadaceae bacterium]|nr:signal peptidase II [Selenomonadaceae bacterium]